MRKDNDLRIKSEIGKHELKDDCRLNLFFERIRQVKAFYYIGFCCRFLLAFL